MEDGCSKPLASRTLDLTADSTGSFAESLEPIVCSSGEFTERSKSSPLRAAADSTQLSEFRNPMRPRLADIDIAILVDTEVVGTQ